MNRGTTSFTDYEYTVTDGYTHALVWYDVRSFFSVNSTYSDPNWVPVFARQDLAKLHDNLKNPAFNLSSGPTEYAISNYPNPFNPTTTLSYQLVEDARVTLTVYDMMGREIITLVQAEKTAGHHSVQWNGRDARNNPAASGIYVYQFTAIPNSSKQTVLLSGKLLLAK